MTNKEFLFSVVIPVYNTEDYIGEAIESIINQTIGFKDNIQLILINDGSIDKSEEICLKYRDMYPDNIIYKYKKNGGVSSARNEGRKYIKGKYFNFLDSDDIWDKNAFKVAYDFFEKNYDEVDVINARTVIFGGKNYVHPLDYKFDQGERIIDLEQEYESIQLGNAACFFKTEAMKEISHSTKLVASEDTLFMGEILLKKMKYGVIPKAIYYYRRLEGGETVSTRALSQKTWYFDVIKYCHKKLINDSIKKYGSIKKFIQYTIFYELQWRLYKNRIIDEILNDKEKKEYRAAIQELLQDIEDEVVMSFKSRQPLFKLYVLNLKYGYNVLEKSELVEGRYLNYKGSNICDLHKKGLVNIAILEIEDNKVLLDGNCSFLYSLIYENKEYTLAFKDNKGNIYKCELNRTEYLDTVSFCDETIVHGLTYSAKVPMNNLEYIEMILITKNNEEIKLRPSLGRHSRLTNLMKNNAYRVVYNKYIIRPVNGSLKFYNYKKKKHIFLELKYLKELIRKRKFKIFFTRLLYWIIKPFYRKPIWIVRDRFEKAGDNGESVFKYLSTWEKRKNYNIYFMLQKDSPDYERVKQYGKIIDPRKFKYKLLFMLSSKIIDSIVLYSSINPFEKEVGYYRNLFRFDYVGLFHGIGQRDMSSWTNKFNYNIKIYVAGAKKEYEAMLKENNGYDENVLKFTGLPRFDELENNHKKFIAFMPTWRQSLAGAVIPGTTKREYKSDFIDSDFFKFYNSLINDERLIKKMKELGYKGEFYNHPNFMQQSKDFKDNETIKVNTKSANANEVISNCSLLVTDYSSAFFECAYLNKPVVYTQFDYDTFIQKHTGTKGYYDYKKDCFGPVCHDLDSSVNAIIEYLENDCKNNPKYEKRIKEFFLYRDKNNSKRLVDEIVKYDEKKREKIANLKELK